MTDEIIPAITSGAFRATRVGLQPPAEKVSFQMWELLGMQLRKVQGAVQWAIGDWFNYGEDTFQEMAAQAWNIWPEYSYDMLRRFARVARYIPYSERRPNISWSMHAELASLSANERNKWMDRLENGLTRADLRLSLNGNSPKETHPCPTCGRVHIVEN